MNRSVGALLVAFFLASCRGPLPQAPAGGTNPVESAGKYRFSTADLRIDLDLRPDRTYYASMDGWARISEESGVWRLEEGDILLKPRSGGLPMPIRQLRPVRQDGTDVLQIVDPDSQIGRAISFSRN